MAKFTELTALEYTINAINLAVEAGDIAEFDQDCMNKLQKMIDSRKKNRNSGNYANSKQAKEVQARAAAVLGWLLKQTGPRTNREIGEAVQGFLDIDGRVSSRRVVCALSKLEKSGMVEKADKIKGYQTYVATDKAREEWAKRQTA